MKTTYKNKDKMKMISTTSNIFFEKYFPHIPLSMLIFSSFTKI